ncbi:MAG TPA: outer membrane protein [Xanthobacteraceae bacterium]|jgi:outer membrane immunogenic protein|nr:outer membrane protein [Xanthobacteraceae bacterium]
MKNFFAGCVAVGVIVTAQCAAAADLSVAPLYKAPPSEVTQAYNWTGFYLGINGGGGWGHSYWDANTTGINLSGGLVGGTAGYNYQIGSAVIGLEGDVDWANLKGTSTSTGCPVGCSTSDTWLSTVRGRAGYAFGGILPYVTGGLAVGDIRAATPGFAGASDTNAGWTAGGGIEFALPGNWSAKAEYLHVDLGRFNCGLDCGLATTDNVSMHDNVFRAGVNYRFGWGK